MTDDMPGMWDESDLSGGWADSQVPTNLSHEDDVRLVAWARCHLTLTDGTECIRATDDDDGPGCGACLTEVLTGLDRQSRLLAAYEAEHEAASELRWRTYLTRMPPIDPDWSQDLSRFNRTHDHVEQVRKEGL